MTCNKTRNVVGYYDYVCLFIYCGCVVFVRMKLHKRQQGESKELSDAVKWDTYWANEQMKHRCTQKKTKTESGKSQNTCG